jgi:phosphoglycolate phosphatase-like HAD superfamily hydrolase
MKGYLFDLDGTLLDSRIAMIEIFKQMSSEFDLEVDLDGNWEACISKGGVKLIEAVFQGNEMSSPELLNIFRKKYAKRKHSVADFYDGAIDFLIKLKANNKLILVTNKPRNIVAHILLEVNLSDIFDFTWCRDESNATKPSAMLAKILDEKLSEYKCNSAYYFGDSEADKKLAESINGCEYLHHRHGYEIANSRFRLFDYRSLGEHFNEK